MEPASETTEVVEDEGTEEEFSEVPSPNASPINEEEFNRRVSVLCEMMKADPTVRDRLIAETYVNIASAEQGIRGMVEAIQSQGIAGMMRGAFSRKG